MSGGTPNGLFGHIKIRFRLIRPNEKSDPRLAMKSLTPCGGHFFSSGRYIVTVSNWNSNRVDNFTFTFSTGAMEDDSELFLKSCNQSLKMYPLTGFPTFTLLMINHFLIDISAESICDSNSPTNQ